MPAAKKRTATKKASTKPRAKSNVSSSVARTKGINWGIIAVVVGVLAIVGIFYVLLTQAATTPITKAAWQRFPGDPNPKLTDKIYWGAGIGGNGNPSRHETPAGVSLSLRRTFWNMESAKVNDMVNTATADLAANRLPQVSIKVPLDDWVGLAAGKYDNEFRYTRPSDGKVIVYTGLNDTIKRLDALNGPVWFTVHHEPENDLSSTKTAAQWRAMQKYVRTRMTALGTKNITFMPILMTWTWDPASGRNPSDWWVDGIWDAYGVDPYAESEGKKLTDSTGWKNFVPWVEAKRLPISIAEWGLTTAENGRSWVPFEQTIYKDDRTSSGEKDYTRYCNAVHNGDSTLLKQTTATQEKVAYDNMYDMWNWARVNDKDLIGISYFDSCLNSEKGPWRMAGRQLDGFREILKSPNVMRVRDAATISVGPSSTVSPSPTTTTTTTTTPSPTPTTGALSINITSPSTTTPVSGRVDVTAGPDTNVQEVSFRLDGAWQTTDTSAPFAWNWDTAKVANGTHTLTIRARRVGDPGDVYTEKSITVTVSNPTTTPTPSADTTKPSAPTAVKGKIEFDALKLAYFTNLTWSASYDNVGVSRYLINRNGTQIGTSTTASYKDYTLQPNVAYLYEVYAQDAAGNTSLPGATKLTGRCFLVWCWSE